jgi:hypothetical protein
MILLDIMHTESLEERKKLFSEWLTNQQVILNAIHFISATNIRYFDGDKEDLMRIHKDSIVRSIVDTAYQEGLISFMEEEKKDGSVILRGKLLLIKD